MATRREYRKIQRTPEEVARLKADRERYQKEKPSLADVAAKGGTILPLRDVLTLHQIGVQLRKERERQQLSLREVAERAGMDEPALSRIETGKNGNPMVETLMRIAEALGKVVTIGLSDREPVVRGQQG